jgi:hypothetical protein
MTYLFIRSLLIDAFSNRYRKAPNDWMTVNKKLEMELSSLRYTSFVYF